MQLHSSGPGLYRGWGVRGLGCGGRSSGELDPPYHTLNPTPMGRGRCFAHTGGTTTTSRLSGGVWGGGGASMRLPEFPGFFFHLW